MATSGSSAATDRQLQPVERAPAPPARWQERTVAEVLLDDNYGYTVAACIALTNVIIGIMIVSSLGCHPGPLIPIAIFLNCALCSAPTIHLSNAVNHRARPRFQGEHNV